MSISGEGSDEEEVFIDEEDIIQEIPIDEEELPDHDEDVDGEDEMVASEDADDSTYAFHGHTDEVYAVACSPIDASLVASGGKDDRGFLWKIGPEDGVLELTGHRDTVCTVAFSSDGNLVASGSFDGQINVWNTTLRALLGTLEGSGAGFEIKRLLEQIMVALGLDLLNADPTAQRVGKLICSGSDDASLRIWDPRSAQSKHVVRGHGYHADGLTCLSITPDSQTVVSGSKDNSVHIVNINSGQVVGSLVGHTGSVECVGISPSFNWAATGGMDQKLIIWDLAHQSNRCTCEHDEGVTCLAWVGLSRYIVSGCIDGKVRIWDSLSGNCARTFSGHANVVQSLAVSADGNSVVSVSTDGSARVFDVSEFK